MASTRQGHYHTEWCIAWYLRSAAVRFFTEPRFAPHNISEIEGGPKEMPIGTTA